MLKLSNGGVPGFIHGKYLKKIPCENLKAIDQLWVEYSSGRFGFSVQKQIWQEVGGKPYDTYDIQDFSSFLTAGKKFNRRVGWNRDDFQFYLDAPVGHLPSSDKRPPVVKLVGVVTPNLLGFFYAVNALYYLLSGDNRSSFLLTLSLIITVRKDT